MDMSRNGLDRRDGWDGSVIEDADAVVIGAGALGASVTFHLAKLGQRVALVDRRDTASQTSARAAGQTQKVRYDRHTTRLAVRSVEKIIGFKQETGKHLAYHQTGGVKIARTPEFADQVVAEVRQGQAWGIDIDLIDAAEVRSLAPFVDPSRAKAIWYCPSDLYLEPRDLPDAYIRAAGTFGATILPWTEVTGIGTNRGAVDRVVTNRGVIRTPVVIDTAGAWGGLITEMVGVRVPMIPTRHQLYVTKPLVGVTADMPIVRIVDGHVYVRPERGGLLFGGYEDEPVQVDLRSMPPDFDIDKLALDWEPMRKLTDDVLPEFPVLRGAEVAEFRGGLPTMTSDGHHIFDTLDSCRGFFIVGGCVVGGLSVSPAVGEEIAQWVIDGEPPHDMSWFSLHRFGPEVATDELLRQACLWRYAHHYQTPDRID